MHVRERGVHSLEWPVPSSRSQSLCAHDYPVLKEVTLTCRLASSSSDGAPDGGVDEALQLAIDASPWQECRSAFKSLSRVVRQKFQEIAGDNHPTVEDSWIYQILSDAFVCRPFVASTTGPGRTSFGTVLRVSGDQNDTVVALPIPIQPEIKRVVVTATAKDQGHCDDPNAGAWVRVLIYRLVHSPNAHVPKPVARLSAADTPCGQCRQNPIQL